ncbi:hypothetical protein BHM03_00045898 [Ensete ventricosum]|nr:hypothetical protein BHM03_00045898 [Ensete ventricosum]
MAGSIELQPDDGPRESLGIGPSLDDAVGSRQKFARRFVEGIGKLAGNAKGDRRKEDRRTCCKIARGYRSMREILVCSRGDRRLDGCWSTHNLGPSGIDVQLFFLDADEGDVSHEGVRLISLDFTSDLQLKSFDECS